MEEQHHIIADLSVDRQPDLRPGHTGDPGRRNRIVDGLAELGHVLLRSLDLEERDVLPAIHEHLSVQEWAGPSCTGKP
ncbi:MAG TPA: hypothetical protein VHZ03_09410 [Trebonia sp.]|nr:hypothetical protein [Trebonia sp.]